MCTRFIKIDGWDLQPPQPTDYEAESSTFYVNIDQIESVNDMAHTGKDKDFKEGTHSRTIVHMAAPPIQPNNQHTHHHYFSVRNETAAELMKRINAILNADKAMCDVPEPEKKA